MDKHVCLRWTQLISPLTHSVGGKRFDDRLVRFTLTAHNAICLCFDFLIEILN